ncbi:MAG TPA: DUF1592 domain-containing protein [Verrucomicrobiae bacterium]|nr:DUF1592 domain-containing protein [Verrucomicrobiae bacterium]
MGTRSLLLILAGIWMAAPVRGILPGVVSQHCAGCHNPEKKKGELDLESIASDSITQHPEIWEKAVKRLRARQMPPADRKRPDEKTYGEMLRELETALDGLPANPGRTETFRRLTRTEYQNSIRDLLALEVDVSTLLPKDEEGHGFDNVSAGTLSPALLNRYISAAEKISALAVGGPRRVGGDTFRIAPDVTQEEHVEGLPPGTRGGTLIAYNFPQDAEYEFQMRLTRDRNEEVEGLREPHQLELLLDGKPLKSFTITPAKDKNYELIDRYLKFRAAVAAGPHKIGVTFVKNPSELLETRRTPYSAHFNMHRHPRIGPAIYQVSINGPYDAKGPGNTPSRKRIFGESWNGAKSTLDSPGSKSEIAAKAVSPLRSATAVHKAEEILSMVMWRAYRRPVTREDLAKPMEFFRAEKGFEAGIQNALSAILVSPQFLFRVEHDQPAKSIYRISDIELASRLSFFLWSSIPDDELLDVAERNELSKPDVLDKQTRRMLADSRAGALVSNFGGQWLYLRNLESFTPDLRLFPDFDDNLRQAFREETEMFFESVLHEDRSVLDLLKTDYTFLNERLAKHYGIPHVYGDRFRRVSTAGERGGLLRNGSVLAVTSYATRTSPVIRGKWVLANLLGTPPPPPLPNVPALKDNTITANLSVRERLAEHRANAACATCHDVMDPVGFALENYDAVGRWRSSEEGKPVDCSGGLPDGSKFSGIEGLERGLLDRPEVFVSTLTEKLLIFALGRGIEYYDGPAIRNIVRDAQKNDYRFSSIIVGIVQSTPFTMRKAL